MVTFCGGFQERSLGALAGAPIYNMYNRIQLGFQVMTNHYTQILD